MLNSAVRSLRRSLAVIILGACAGSCAGTPMPAPPIDPPPAPNPERIVYDAPTPTSPGQLVLEAGAVADATQLFVLNLDTQDDALLLDPEADGTFTVPIEVGVLRLESIDEEGLRSAPLDLQDGMPLVPLLGCLEIPSQHDPAAGPLRIENMCADSAGADVQLRRDGSYTVSAMRIDLAAGESFDLDVSAMAGAPADALFFLVDAPMMERRAVTLF